MKLHKDSDTSFVANFKRCGNPEKAGWGDTLRHFNILPYTTCNADLVLKFGNLTQRTLYLIYMLCTRLPFVSGESALLKSIEAMLRKKGIHITGAGDGAYPIAATDNVSFIRGYFQDKRFFHLIRTDLLREFTPKQPPLAHNSQLYQIIAQPDTVCVSVRRGDFLSPAYKNDFYVCTPEYFNKAIDSICRQIAHPRFIFFSDDIEWVESNFRVDGHPCYYERGDNPVWEKLRLMYSCHHFIIANSTFSWWAQYLGNREGKIVICPSRWFANSQWHSNLINDDFQFIDA